MLDPNTYTKVIDLLEDARTHARLAEHEASKAEQDKLRARERARRTQALRMLNE